MRIKLTSVTVADQSEALEFYTNTLGFVKKQDLPLGEHRWLTVVSPDDPEGTELLLEPSAFAPAVTYQKALSDAGIPAASFASSDVRAEYDKLQAKGVRFIQEPTDVGTTVIATFDDTCGNLIQMHQES